ncbi:MAG: GNAT family N-acetyltransferase [Actinomycetota bacterium]|nr:GNAT family N-acetyltransferase [Actinomycetota bacterium]
MKASQGPISGVVRLRDVAEDDLPIFFDHQRDPVANRMAAFPARDREAFFEHWTTKILGDDTVTKRTILADEQVVGNIGSWEMSGETIVGYWIGRDQWGKGIASRALSLFIGEVHTRPLYAHVAKHNLASIRVLEKSGFVRVGEAIADDQIEEVILRLDPSS